MGIYNIEELLPLISKKIKGITNIRKWDGISVECTLSDLSKKDKIQDKIRSICTENEMAPVVFEDNEINNNIFLFQLPDFEPVYTIQQINGQYTELFKFLLDNFTSHKGVDTGLEHLLEIHDNMVKLAIQAYYRSNVNRYHTKESDMLEDIDLRVKLNDLYKQVVMEYKGITKKGDINNDND